MHEAILYNKLFKDKIQCRVCNHFCLILPNKTGKCGRRQNINGILFILNYGKIIAENIDPIIKKPIFNYLPNTKTYSIALAGCNFSCLHCQNAGISQIKKNSELVGNLIPKITPNLIIKKAVENNCPSISYTYTEPTIFVEFALECMKLAKTNSLKNIWVSNGFMSLECLDLIFPYLDACNIDLKFFKEKSYQKICGSRLQPVLDNLVNIKNHGIHLEITTLIIPKINDSDRELKAIANFIFNKLGCNTPWHVSAFYPAYKIIDKSPTPMETILRAQKIGQKAGLKFVYTGNI